MDNAAAIVVCWRIIIIILPPPARPAVSTIHLFNSMWKTNALCPHLTCCPCRWCSTSGEQQVHRRSTQQLPPNRLELIKRNILLLRLLFHSMDYYPTTLEGRVIK